MNTLTLMAQTETLPIRCASCGEPVTVEFQPYVNLKGVLQSENEYPCPHCWTTVEVQLPGRLVDWWSGHGSDPLE